MAKKTVQGLAAGILLATSVFAYMYFFQTTHAEIEQEDIEIPEIELSSEEMMDILKDQGFIILGEEEYQLLLKGREEAQRENSQEEEREPRPQTIHYTIIKIQSGMSSMDVANYLEKVNVLDDTEQFLQFLRDNELTHQIKAGEFELNSLMTVEEIALTITQ
ncbi:hypothetical protein [Alkalihalobacterium elongatum]|uniref:hypothetical protein n=1 Tax=Alkalihalobacterium elongatum TaxID=2675466 RepID=UPI001C1F98EB|nr:hypothetical protein [Alkalihalobacterium elongatum]